MYRGSTSVRRCDEVNACYQVFVAGSGKYNEIGFPFGYLKASSTNQAVNLIVMPYNYPVLVPLLGMCAVLLTVSNLNYNFIIHFCSSV